VIDQSQLSDVQNATVYHTSGDKIGSVEQIYFDDDTGRPAWVTVNTGLFGSGTSFVPMADATVEGDRVVVPHDKATVKNAPRVQDDRHLDRDEEAELYRYYGLAYDPASGPSADTSFDTDGQDTSGPTTDSAMTRSEEELRVGTQRQEAGRVRLRKYVTTEQESVTVPVRREEVRVEREPITEANADAATSGPEISEEEHEVVLHEERPVVSTQARPVERVRLGTEEVADTQDVTGQVRKEHIEVDGDAGGVNR
jgi:uncharacterized protein (TIGR02271 family)